MAIEEHQYVAECACSSLLHKEAVLLVLGLSGIRIFHEGNPPQRFSTQVCTHCCKRRTDSRLFMKPRSAQLCIFCQPPSMGDDEVEIGQTLRPKE
eukprot:CAMPEP_0172775714 /NCGR_PEP_ID=MMETSP1074-20121228/198464_1 /TAXON_ID=2916 /ORGANISM="Ceratium fusus, Strain PA161109" /LENGTH=94 /DNA_ID=CAMNT_0013612365 /DNA_START=44 /DNA_END=328 /DNA_ORIENTATION=+